MVRVKRALFSFRRASLDSIPDVYAAYERSAAVQARRDTTNPGNRFMFSERHRALEELISSRRVEPSASILEIGCGRGDVLFEIGTLVNTDWSRVYGIDLILDRIREARSAVPHARTWVQSAERLPFMRGSVDVILAFTVLSSIHELPTLQSVAQSAWRVLAPGGCMIIWDMRYPNPQNPNVHPVTKRTLHSLFPEAQIESRSLILIPQLARRIRTPFFYTALRCIPGLRSHRLSVLTKPRSDNPD